MLPNYLFRNTHSDATSFPTASYRSPIVMGEALDIPTQLGFICDHWNEESPKVPSRYPIVSNYYRLHWIPERTKNSTNRKQGMQIVDSEEERVLEGRTWIILSTHMKQ
jgi:hypothetical protein